MTAETIRVRAPESGESPGPNWRDAHVIERPYPGLAICDTAHPGNYSLTHENTGLAVLFTASLGNARAAAEMLDMVDWSRTGDDLNADQDVKDVVCQVQYLYGEGY